MLQELINCAHFLDNLADRLDEWARESREGGWSTHQVEANRNTACACRRKSMQIREVIFREQQASDADRH